MIQNTKIKTVTKGERKDFTIDVSVGNGQPSSTGIYRNGILIHSETDSFTFGCTEIISGDKILLVTTVSDLPQNPNRITVTHTVVQTNTVASFDDNVSEGEIAIETTSFYFL